MANEKNGRKADSLQKNTKKPRELESSNAGKSKKPRAVQKNAPRQASPDRLDPVPESSLFLNQLLPFVFVVLAVLLTAFFLLSKIDGAVGSVGVLIRDFFCGLFGWPAFVIPLILINLAVFWRKYVDLGIVKPKLFLSAGCLISVSALVHVFAVPTMNPTHYNWGDYGRSLFGLGEPLSNWTYGVRLTGGGFFGGLIGGLFRVAFGYVGALIILFAMLLIFVLFLFGITPGYLIDMIKYKARQRREAEAEVRAEKREERSEKRAVKQAIAADRRRAAAAEAQLLREEREAQLAEKRAARAAAAEGKTRHIPDFEELIPGQTTYAATEEDPAAPTGPDPVLITPMPDDDIPLSKPTPAPKEDRTINAAAAEPAPASTPAPAADSEPQTVKKISPVREGSRSGDPYGLNEIFGSGELSSGETKKEAAAEKAPAEEAPQSSGELEIKLTPISDQPHDDADVSMLSPNADTTPERPANYTFPPVELLHPNSAPARDDVEAELRTNAQKLMETLSSFNVKIKKIEYSRGPTITRYELYPEAGTRIRTISNLVDDIALSLATTGVRIEAPIPNKSAVGVEVPNRVRCTVFIRELLESEVFRNSESRLTACLGKDVAGNMIIFDIGKMPHLLIAGTTGSGKSVCINCIILSLLYKARPDEVQLIMIDPKKIEMSMYSDLPHLKVPVVTDTQKATGTLNAAVNEMEHRFELFEDVGVRDIDGYNKITAGDPERPRLPKIVIIIDELADLMMTAPDQIETSICRLAQKARAAGIHLIIGTQRPSVDVITGLIKANVPSRIAFTVASQVDSRTIIDIAGAEKLIGKGDMLYAPIGSLKPRRAQGALVADDEVEAVTAFIKENYGCADYDGDFMSDIDREAERVSAGKKGAAAFGGGDTSGSSSSGGGDPQFRQALKIAVDNGTIATSYLQRTLSIGYGRAARLIDQMAKMGFVSGMNGTKPRTVLLTLPQYMEMEARGDTRLDGIIPSEEE